MNKSALTGFVLTLIGVLTNVYWYRRERTVRESLTTSRRLEANGEFERAELIAAREAASTLNTRPEDLPEKVEKLDGKMRSLHAEVNDTRNRWARAWWKARTESGVQTDDPSIIVATIPDGELADVETLAQLISQKENGVALLGGPGDGSFAVVVDDRLTEKISATALATEISDFAGGGAGGTERYAVGGGATNDLDAALDRTKEHLKQNTTVL